MKISIITPNYNYAQFIGKAIESVVKQDYDNIEHIIVDDGSTDNSVEIIKSYQKKYPGIIKLIQQENKGQTKALNVALSHVTGDIIGWLNSDDTYCEGIFSEVIKLFKSDETIDAVYGNINIIDKDDNIIRNNKYLKFNYLSAVFNGFGKEIPSNGIFWKRTKSNILLKFNELFEYAMDSEYWSRLLFNKKIKKIDLTIANFRWHENAKTIKSKNVNDIGYKRVKEEEKIIFISSYNKTKISKYIPIKYSYLLYLLFRIRRLLLRGIKGEYIKRNRL